VLVSRRGESSVEVFEMEARAKDGDHESIHLWPRLLSATDLVKGEVQSRLRCIFGTTLAWFDLLAQLERHPEGLVMGPLFRRGMVTAGNVTRLVDQLEADGLVARVPDPGDRRAVWVRLTPEWRRKFSVMATVHEGWIVKLFRGPSLEEREQLYTLLGVLKQSVARALS